MSESAEDPLVGQVLSGRFQILAPLGKGGMGMVYKAVQQPLDRVVALKVLNPRYDSSKDPGFERRFFLEASMTAKLKHPNTITVHDYGRTDDGIYFIAMEFLEGETLSRLISREKRLPWPRTLVIGAQIARSLREAHKLGMIHRDLKPANIMLLSEGTGGDVVKVLDFGLVKSLMPDQKPADAEITQAGVLLGSPLYMAPEQAKGEADQRTDIYALGVLLYQCLAGQPPFHSKDSFEVIVKHLKEPVPPLRPLAPDVPNDVIALVMRCLEKNPAARFQSMDEVLEAMRAATAETGLSSGLFVDPRSGSGVFGRTTNPTGQPVVSAALDVSVDTDSLPRARRGSKRPLVIGAAIVVLGVAAGGLVATRVLAPPPETVTAPPPVVKPPPVVRPPTLPPTPLPPPKPGPVEVVFEVSSEPSGATVTRDGVTLGVTPLSVKAARTGELPAAVELELALDGYEPATVAAQGSSGAVPVKQVLKKKAAAPTKTPPKGPKPPPTKKDPNGDGYKDDPYQ